MCINRRLPAPAIKLIAVRRPLQLICLLPWIVLACGQAAASSPQSLSPAQAQALVGRALATEISTAQDANHPMRFLLRKSSPRLTATKDIVETRDGAVARLISVNDTPLDQAAEQNEQARLDTLMSDPSLQRHRKQGEDADMASSQAPAHAANAFLYQYAGSAASPSGNVEKFTFTPNPGSARPTMRARR